MSACEVMTWSAEDHCLAIVHEFKEFDTRPSVKQVS